MNEYVERAIDFAWPDAMKPAYDVVIIGGGFGGLQAAKQLANAPVQVTLLDCRNHHVFTPLLYQVATAGLSPGDIASPIRWVLRHQKNARVLLGDDFSEFLDSEVARVNKVIDDLGIGQGGS